MRQGNTLWRPGRSGRVHDTAEVVRLRGNGIDRVLLAELAQLLDAHDLEVGKVGFQLVHVVLVDFLVGVVDDIFDGFHIGEDIRERADQ